jgi:hypothetical protein
VIGVPSRQGALLVEMIVALSIGAALLTTLAMFVTSSVRWHRSMVSRAEGLEVARTVWAVLEEELGAARRGRDWAVDSAGALNLRAFRGFGRVCPDSDGDELTVLYRGERLPEPIRDSALVLQEDGEWTSAPLTYVAAAAIASSCDARPGEAPLRVAGPPTPAGAVLVRFFERGSYHITDSAFRYRRGEGGRQPLTPERLGPESGFSDFGDALQVTLEVLPSRDALTRRVFSWRVREGGLSP